MVEKMQNKLILDLAALKKDNKDLISYKKGNDKDIYFYKVDDKNRKYYQRNIGDYYILKTKDINNIERILIKDVQKVIKKILGKYKAKKVLIVGLGNSSIACDSLGPKTTNKIIATNHYNDFLTIPKIALFNPEITNKTGISSFSLIKMVVEHLKPDCLIIIDSLLTNDLNNLDCCIEISDGGIIPGIYLKDNRQIDKKTFNIPIISLGVSLACEIEKKLLTSPNVSEIVETYSDLIAHCLNKVLID